MLTKEKLSEIAENAIGTLHYTYSITNANLQNGFLFRLLLHDQPSDELVSDLFVYEGDNPGRFSVDFDTARNNKTDRIVLRDINSQLYEYFNKQFEPKFYIRLLNTDYGYLTRVEGTDLWSVTSLKIAKMSNQKSTFTADEIDEIAQSDLCANLSPMDLWRAAEEVEED